MKQLTQTFIVGLLLALLLVACGGATTTTEPETADEPADAPQTEETTSEEPEPAAQGERTISILTYNSAEEMQPLLDAWAVENPDVKIELQTVPWSDLNPVMESRVGAGDSTPDIYYVDQPRAAALAHRGLLADLTDLIDIPEGQIMDLAVEWSTIDGKLMVMPAFTATQLLFYNKDLLEEAGSDIPSTDPEKRWTWEEVVEAGNAVQDAELAEWGLLFEQGATPYQVQPLAESLGGGSGLTGDGNLTPALTTDGWVKAMEWWAAVHEDGTIPRGMGFGVTSETFSAGEAPFFLAGPWQMWMVGNADIPFEVGVAPHPYFEGGEAATPTGSDCWGINPASENIEDAAAFLAFLGVNPVGNAAYVEGTGSQPVNLATAETFLAQPALQSGVDVTVAELLEYEALNTARLRPMTIGYVQYETIVGAALEDIRNGLPIMETLENAEVELEAALAALDE